MSAAPVPQVIQSYPGPNVHPYPGSGPSVPSPATPDSQETGAGRQEAKAPPPTEDSCLQRIGKKVSRGIEGFFSSLGRHAATRPILFIIIPIVLSLLLAIGFMRFDTENNQNKLFTPVSSQAVEDQEWVEAQFSTAPRFLSIYLVSDTEGNNVFTQQDVLSVWDLVEGIKNVTATYEGEELTWANRCIKAGPSCMDPSSIASYFDSRSQIESMTQAQMGAHIKARVNSNIPHPKPKNVMGAFQTTSTGDFSRAEAYKVSVMLQNVKFERSGRLEDYKSSEWEVAVNDYMKETFPEGKSGDGLEAWAISQGITRSESSSIGGDAQKLSIGYALMIIYTTIVLSKASWVRSHGLMAVASVVSILLAILSAYGSAFIFGVKYNNVVGVLALLLLGLGIDDSFVIMEAYHVVGKQATIADRMAKALGQAGSSILVTSVTDFTAFLIGSITILPALQAFCWFAALGILFDFLYQVTFFVGCLTYNARREERSEGDCCCCLGPKDPEAKCAGCCCLPTPKNTDGQRPKGFMHKLVEWGPERMVGSTAGRVVILVVTVAILALGIVGSIQLKQDFNIEWFTSEDSVLQKAYDVRDKYFNLSVLQVGFYTKDIDYKDSGVRDELVKVLDTASKNKWLAGETCEAWFVSYNQYITGKTNPDDWDNHFPLWKATPQGISYARKLAMSSDTVIKASEFTCITTREYAESGEKSVDAMNDLRAIGVESKSFDVIVYSFVFLFWEGFAAITGEAIRNVLLAGAAVFLVCLVLLANVWLSILVLLMIALIDVNLLGFMYWVGLDFNSVTVINLVLAIGLAVDYSVHIAHTFLHLQGTKQERAVGALSRIGAPVANGAFSTFLSIVALASAQSYVFKAFFRMFSLIITLGVWHGLFVLPTVLSFVGPASVGHPEEEEGEHEMKEAPQKPGQEEGVEVL